MEGRREKYVCINLYVSVIIHCGARNRTLCLGKHAFYSEPTSLISMSGIYDISFSHYCLLILMVFLYSSAVFLFFKAGVCRAPKGSWFYNEWVSCRVVGRAPQLSTSFYPSAFVSFGGSRVITTVKIRCLFSDFIIHMYGHLVSTDLLVSFISASGELVYNRLLPLLIWLFRLSHASLIWLPSRWFLPSFKSIDLVITYTQKNLYLWRDWLDVLTKIHNCVATTTTMAKVGNESIGWETVPEPHYSLSPSWKSWFWLTAFRHLSPALPFQNIFDGVLTQW